MTEPTYALQRRLQGDCAKWRTVVRVSESKVARAMAIATELGLLGEPVEWQTVLEVADANGRATCTPFFFWTRARGWFES